MDENLENTSKRHERYFRRLTGEWRKKVLKCSGVVFIISSAFITGFITSTLVKDSWKKDIEFYQDKMENAVEKNEVIEDFDMDYFDVVKNGEDYQLLLYGDFTKKGESDSLYGDDFTSCAKGSVVYDASQALYDKFNSVDKNGNLRERKEAYKTVSDFVENNVPTEVYRPLEKNVEGMDEITK